MTQAHAQDRDLAAERAHCLVGDARVIGSSWSGRDDYAIELCQLVHAHLVVAKDRRLRAELGHVLDEVVGERVVVVDHGEARHHIASAISMALNIAPAFSRVSSYSRSGLESATTPQPAWTYASPSVTTTVRRLIAMSRLPSIPCSARSLRSLSSSFSRRWSSAGSAPRRLVPASGRVSTRRPSTWTSFSGDVPTTCRSPPRARKNM